MIHFQFSLFLPFLTLRKVNHIIISFSFPLWSHPFPGRLVPLSSRSGCEVPERGGIGLSRFTYSQLVERDRSGTRRLTMISSMLRGRVWVWGQGLEEEIIGNRWKELDYGGEVPSFIPFLTSPSSSVHDGLFEGRWKLLGLKSIFYFQLMIFYNNFHLPPFLTLRSVSMTSSLR